jgi:hypothetical protein
MNCGLITLNSGQTLTVGGPFSAGDYQVFTGTGIVDGLKESRPEWFAVNTTPGTTDMAPAILAAIAAVQTKYGQVLLDATTYAVGQQIITQNRVPIIGKGKRSTCIKALAAFPESTAVVRLGPDENYIFDTYLQDLYINANDVTGSIGVYTDGGQEGCGIRNVMIQNYRAYGVYFNGTGALNASILFIENYELLPSHLDSTAGIYMKSVGGQSTIQYGTVNGSYLPAPEYTQVGTHGDGILVEGSDVNIIGFHGEAHTNGIRFATGAFGTVIDAYGGPATTMTNVVKVDSGAYDVTMIGIIKNVATNSLTDSKNARTITASQVALYTTGATYHPKLIDRTDLNVTSSASAVLTASATADATKRYSLYGTGLMEWGNGTDARDTTLYRNSANVLRTGGGFMIGVMVEASAPNSSVYIDSVSGKLSFKDSGGSSHALY